MNVALSTIGNARQRRGFGSDADAGVGGADVRDTRSPDGSARFISEFDT
jgi:hypothetical protein